MNNINNINEEFDIDGYEQNTFNNNDIIDNFEIEDDFEIEGGAKKKFKRKKSSAQAHLDRKNKKPSQSNNKSNENAVSKGSVENSVKTNMSTSMVAKSNLDKNVSNIDNNIYLIYGTFISVLLLSNFLTYLSFRYLNTNETDRMKKGEKSLLFIIIYLYTILYMMFNSYILKWVLQLIQAFSKDFDSKPYDNLLNKTIKKAFRNAILTMPLYFLIAFMSYIFDSNLLFGVDNKYSPYFQIYMFFTSTLLLLIFEQKKDLSFNMSNESIIKYFIIFITALSIVKQNLDISSSRNFIDRASSGFINVFLNFNWKLFYAVIPCIIFILGLAFVVLEVPPDDIIKYFLYILAGIGGFLMLAFVNGSYKKKSEKKEKENGAAFKSIMTWGLFLAVFSAPVFLYVYLNDGNDALTKVIDIYRSILMNKVTLKILAISFLVLSIIQTQMNINSEKIKQLTSFLVLVALYFGKADQKL